MVNDFEVGFEVFVLDLLEENFELVFDFFGFVEKVELFTLTRFEVLINEFVN